MNLALPVGKARFLQIFAFEVAKAKILIIIKSLSQLGER
jgi:hypothetical protein